MSGLVDGLASRGFARDCLHTEKFGSGQSKTPGIAVVPRRRRMRREKPRRSGRLYPLRQQSRCTLGFHIPQPARNSRSVRCAVRWSRHTGVCHNCEAGLISGFVIYRPDPVEPPAEGNLLTCGSEPQGDIALDL